MPDSLYPTTVLELLRDVDAGKVCQDSPDDVWLALGPDGSADVTAGAWALYREDLAEPGTSADENGVSYWRLTDKGRAVLDGETS